MVNCELRTRLWGNPSGLSWGAPPHGRGCVSRRRGAAQGRPTGRLRSSGWSLVGLAALALTACQTIAPRPATLILPESLRSPCERPDPSKVSTVGDLAGFSLKQDAAISICDARRKAVVEIVDAANPKPRRKLFGVF